jgi:hypothetical protein
MANAITAQTDPAGGQKIQLQIKYASSCSDHTYNIKSQDGKIVFSGLLHVPTCGDGTVPFKDATGTAVMTAIAHMTSCYLDWEVKDGKDATVGHVVEPKCVQALQARYLPCLDSVVLRACDAADTKDIFTIRNPGLCSGCCTKECCDLRCGCFCACFKCGVLDFKISVHSGDMANKAPVAEVHWLGHRELCPPFRVLPGYTFTVTTPPGATYNDSALLVLLAIFLDSVLLPGAARRIPVCGEPK